ncbi:hypothetical protein ACVWXO_004310 [Bradyrhizobium sp. LM2.7]
MAATFLIVQPSRCRDYLNAPHVDIDLALRMFHVKNETKSFRFVQRDKWHVRRLSHGIGHTGLYW